MKILAYADFEDICGITDSCPLALTDASLLCGGKPQFLPDLEHEYILLSTAGLVLRNTGRKIAPRFVHRYCENIVLSTLLVDVTELNSRRGRGLPYTTAVSFDFNVVRGTAVPFSEELMDAWCMTTEAGGETRRWSSAANAADWRDRLSMLSRMFTFRTGDLILPAAALPIDVCKDCHVRLAADISDYPDIKTTYDYNIK